MTQPRKRPPHVFVADPTIPPDHNGRRTCRCQLVGEPGDAHHAMPGAVDDVRTRAAGEGGGS